MGFLSKWYSVAISVFCGRVGSPKSVALAGLLLLITLRAVGSPTDPANCRYLRVSATARPFIPVVAYYLRHGDSVYALKEGYHSCRQSLSYFDTANAIAQRLKDTALLAETTFALGRVYDAWNEDPPKTIALFEQSVAYMKAKSTDTLRRYYAAFLLAHAYRKAGDTLGALQQLEALWRALRKHDTAFLRRMPSTVEMAAAAADIGALKLADRILEQLTRREWIKNDVESYNYLNHYFLTRAHIDLGAGRLSTPYLDSFRQSYEVEKKPETKAYYAHDLALLYEQTHNYEEAFRFRKEADRLFALTTTHSERKLLSDALSRTEKLSLRRQQYYQENIRSTRLTAFWVLSTLLLIISILSFYLYRRGRRYRSQSKLLQNTNRVLDEKVAYIELINRERDHRFKNNLNAVQSLLQMQSRQAPLEEVAARLRVAQMRVESIALLHNMLLQGRGQLSFAAYAESLFKGVLDCYADEKAILFHLDIEEWSFPEEFYAPFSLILNEWITNSVKYAQPAGEHLNLFLSLKTKSGTSIVIDYHDDGLPLKTTTIPPEGLGSQIIYMLARQMGATLLQDSPFHYKITLLHERENQSPNC